MPSILDPSFEYTPAHSTDIRKRFKAEQKLIKERNRIAAERRRIEAELAEADHARVVEIFAQRREQK